MTDPEAFALHMSSLFCDAVNGESMVLKCLIERIDPNLVDPVQGNVKAFLLACVETMQQKKDRACADCKAFVGGEEKWTELSRQDFHANFAPSGRQWKPVEVVQVVQGGSEWANKHGVTDSVGHFYVVRAKNKDKNDVYLSTVGGSIRWQLSMEYACERGGAWLDKANAVDKLAWVLANYGRVDDVAGIADHKVVQIILE